MKTNKVLISFIGICFITTIVYCNPTAHVGESQIIGQRIRHLNMEANQFLRIPYAQPPVGDLRFQPTKPIENLPNILKADRQPPACPQYTENPFPWYINSTEKSEDCLYLNIWTPKDASPENTKAVFYWIHGGGFRYGSIRDPLYSGIPLAALGDIVVVTVNYRLGPFGFMSSGTKDAPGNAGFWDILEGLRWVNRNIKAFGGDPERVTIGGESAGSMAVAMFGASPLSQGLYARQILQSGSPTVFKYGKNNERNRMLAQNLSVLVGCANETYTMSDYPSEVVRCLKDVDAETLSRMDSFLVPHSSADFLPQFGDEIIPAVVYEAIAKGGYCHSELLIGVTRDEGSVFLTTTNPELFGFFGHKDHQINKTAGKDVMRKMFTGFPDLDALINHYLPDTLPEDDFKEVRHRVHTSLGDMTFTCPSAYHAAKCASEGHSVYFYSWSHRPSVDPWAPWTGVTHFGDVQFVFGRPVLNPRLYEKVEKSVSIQMIEIWSSYIKNGKPSIRWPVYKRDFPIFKKLGPGMKMQNHGVGPHHSSCNFLKPFFGF